MFILFNLCIYYFPTGDQIEILPKNINNFNFKIYINNFLF